MERSPGEGNGNPLQYSCLENGLRVLEDYSSWDHKELDMAERLHFHFLVHSKVLVQRRFSVSAEIRKERKEEGKEMEGKT